MVRRGVPSRFNLVRMWPSDVRRAIRWVDTMEPCEWVATKTMSALRAIDQKLCQKENAWPFDGALPVEVC
jgi:hypothetical protein